MGSPTQEKNKKNNRLFCKNCKIGKGYPTENQIRWYGTMRKLMKNYLCRRCRKRTNYGDYLRKIRRGK